MSGPLATLATAVVFDILTRRGIAVPSPFVLLLVPVIWAASRGGVRPGIVSAVFVMRYSLHYYSLPDSPLTYAPADAARAVAVLVGAPAAAILVGLLRQRDIERAELRAAATAIGVAPAPPFPVPLGEPIPGASVEAVAAAGAAQAIPALGDWCAVHLVDDAGRLRCIATAHGDPVRVPLVRALQRLGPHAPDGRVTPGGVWGGPAPVLLDAAEPTLTALADGPEELRLYRALAAARILTVPLAARGRSIGVLEIGTASPEMLTAATVPAAARHAVRITTRSKRFASRRLPKMPSGDIGCCSRAIPTRCGSSMRSPSCFWM